MRFSDQFLDDIRTRLPISQVVGEHVQWDKRKSQPGRGDFWACCPFHGEKSPSFHADDRRGRYHCFGCGASGDHFRFLTEKTGMSFPDAVEKLAGIAGIAMPTRDAASEKRQEARRSLYDVLELATRYFEAALANTIGARARGYLNERNISPQLQTRFRLGFAPDSRNGLKEHLAANGVSADDMIAAGLVVHGEGIAVPYDRFRNRVIFPITDLRGRVIAFGGRALSPDVPAKYLNSPETELFHKRLTLYNGQVAREAARSGKPVVVVEGYVDVIAAVGAGFEGTVAPLGTALTEEHLNLLWQMSAAPILCFDGDSAGQRAAERSAELILPLLKPGFTAKFITLPEGLDPDDLIRQRGRAAFAELAGDARPLSDVIWAMETRGLVDETPEGRAAVEARLRERAQSIADPSVRRHYGQAFAEKLAALFAPAARTYERRGEQRRFGRDGARGIVSRGRAGPKVVVSEALRNSHLLKSGRKPDTTAREAIILMSLINHPELAESRFETLAALEFRSPSAGAILNALLDLISHHHEVGAAELRQMLESRGHGEAIGRMQTLLERQGVWQTGPEIAPIDAETGLKHALALHYKAVELNKELRAAELALGDDPSDESFERLRDIQNQITSVDGTEALIEGFGSLSGRGTRSF